MKIIIQLLLFCLLSFSFAYANEVDAVVDRSEVQQGESFELSLSLTGDIKAKQLDSSALTKDFTILSQGQSTKLQIVNGVRSQQLMYKFVLTPKTTGTLTIPSLKFGDQETKPLTIKVTKVSAKNSAGKSSELFLLAKTDKKTVYQNGQLIYTLRIYTRKNFFNAQLQEPRTSAEVDLIKLGDDIEYHAKRNEQDYLVIERRYVVIPQQRGKLTIDAPILTATLDDETGFFGANLGKQITRTAEPVTVNVKPPAKRWTDQSWLVANELSVNDSWSQEQATVGEPLTRTISILGVGVLGEQLPEFKFDNLNGFKAYPDQPVITNSTDNNGLLTKYEQKIAYVPTKQGPLTIPELNIRWWDAKNNKEAAAKIAAKRFQIAPADVDRQPPTTSSKSNTIASTDNSVRTLDSDQEPTITQASTETNKFWPMLTVIVALGWLVTLGLWWYSNRQQQDRGGKRNAPNVSHESLKQARTALHKACLANQPQATKTSALAWAKARWPQQDVHNLSELANRLGDRHFAQRVSRLNRVLYDQQDAKWSGSDFWAAFEEAEKGVKTRPKKAQNKDGLPSLHPE